MIYFYRNIYVYNRFSLPCDLIRSIIFLLPMHDEIIAKYCEKILYIFFHAHKILYVTSNHTLSNITIHPLT